MAQVNKRGCGARHAHSAAGKRGQGLSSFPTTTRSQQRCSSAPPKWIALSRHGGESPFSRGSFGRNWRSRSMRRERCDERTWNRDWPGCISPGLWRGNFERHRTVLNGFGCFPPGRRRLIRKAESGDVITFTERCIIRRSSEPRKPQALRKE